MQYLNLIYITPHLFGHKIQIQVKYFVLQKKSLRIIYFVNQNAHTSPLFREPNILKLPDNYLCINKYFNKSVPTIFKNWFTLSPDFHNYNTRSNLGCIVSSIVNEVIRTIYFFIFL